MNLTDAITAAIGDLDDWAQQCHAASLALVKSRALEEFAPHGIKHPGRVARGMCKGVGSQHSWVILSDDIYDPWSLIVDVTAWSYGVTDDRVWVGNMAEDGLHTPHGSLSIWGWGQPQRGDGEPILLDTASLSPKAVDFLRMVTPLDAVGWMTLWSSNAMQGWPAAEILDAFLDQHPTLAGIVPIDVIGHLTDRNPNGLYLP